MAEKQRVHRAGSTRTKAQDFSKVPSRRNFMHTASHEAMTPSRLRRRILIYIAIILAISLVAWGSLTYYTARRNSPANVLASTVKRIYTIGYQERAYNNLDKEKAQGIYTPDHMLIKANPFGTNTNSLYVYFVTNQPMSLSYSVTSDNTNYPTFTRTVTTLNQRNRTHEFQVLGLIPSAKNTITFTLIDGAGKTITRTSTYTMGDLLSDAPVQISVKNLTNSGDSIHTTSSYNGLFAVMPHANEHTNFLYLYDSNGILRGEIPLQNSTATRLIYYDDLLYFAISITQLVAMDTLGHITTFFPFDGRYSLAGDFTLDSQGNILAIASNADNIDSDKEVGNFIVRFNSMNGKMKLVTNLSTILNQYRITTVRSSLGKDGTADSARWNWLGLNSIALLDDNHFLLSSRETSSILTVDITDSPSITSIIGPADIWKDPQYSYLLLKKTGTFDDSAGQSDLTVSNVSSHGYDVTFFNNNFAYSPSNPSFSWSAARPHASQRFDASASEASSFVYTYHINSTKRTYSLVSSHKTTYAPINGNAHIVDDSILTTDTRNGTWTIRDANGSAILYDTHVATSQENATLAPLYRVQYCDFNNF